MSVDGYRISFARCVQGIACIWRVWKGQTAWVTYVVLCESRFLSIAAIRSCGWEPPRLCFWWRRAIIWNSQIIEFVHGLVHVPKASNVVLEKFLSSVLRYNKMTALLRVHSLQIRAVWADAVRLQEMEFSLPRWSTVSANEVLDIAYQALLDIVFLGHTLFDPNLQPLWSRLFLIKIKVNFYHFLRYSYILGAYFKYIVKNFRYNLVNIGIYCIHENVRYTRTFFGIFLWVETANFGCWCILVWFLVHSKSIQRIHIPFIFVYLLDIYLKYVYIVLFYVFTE